MKRSIRFITHLAAFFLLFAFPALLKGQERGNLRLGFSIGRSADFHRTTDIRWMEDSISSSWGNSIGFSSKFGIAAEYRFDSGWGIIAQIDYVIGSGKFTGDDARKELFEIEYFSDGQNFDTGALNISYEYTARTTYRHVDFALLGSRTIAGNDSTYRIGVALGPVISRVLELKAENTVDIVQDKESSVQTRFANPGGLPMENIGERLILYNDEISNTEDWQFGVRAGIFGNIGSLDDNGIVFSPGIYIDYGLTSLLPQPQEWKTVSVTGRIDVTFGL